MALTDLFLSYINIMSMFSFFWKSINFITFRAFLFFYSPQYIWIVQCRKGTSPLSTRKYIVYCRKESNPTNQTRNMVFGNFSLLQKIIWFRFLSLLKSYKKWTYPLSAVSDSSTQTPTRLIELNDLIFLHLTRHV